MFEIIISAGLFLSVVFGLGALSGYVSERAGIVNIAINGMMVFGALIYSILRGSFGVEGVMQIPALLIVLIATGGFSFLHSFICVKLNANQVISGTAINLLAGGLALFLISVVYKKSSTGIESSFENIGVTQVYNSWALWLNILAILAIATIILMYLIMRFTRFGLRLKASGENPHALAAQGVSVASIRYRAVFISGMLAGFAGAVYAQSSPTFEGSVNGYGFIALAIMIAGQWRIPLLALAAVVFGVLTAFARSTDSGLPQFIKDNKDFIRALPFLVSLLVLVLSARTSRAPAAVGLVYEKDRR